MQGFIGSCNRFKELEDPTADIDIVEVENVDQRSPELFVRRAIRNTHLDFNRNTVHSFADARFSIIPHDCPTGSNQFQKEEIEDIFSPVVGTRRNDFDFSEAKQS
jgi:hypothetical protein